MTTANKTKQSGFKPIEEQRRGTLRRTLLNDHAMANKGENNSK